MDTSSDTQREEQEGGGDGGNKTFNTWDELRMQLSDQPFKQRNRRKHAWLYLKCTSKQRRSRGGPKSLLSEKRVVFFWFVFRGASRIFLNWLPQDPKTRRRGSHYSNLNKTLGAIFRLVYTTVSCCQENMVLHKGLSIICVG